MKIKILSDYLEYLAPLSLQENYDNCGLIIGEFDKDISKALITLDINEKVLDEAIDTQCNLVISHHPMIFRGITKLNNKNLTEKLVVKAIKNEIAIYAMHTNLDNSLWGVNAILGEKLGLTEMNILSPATEGLKKLVVFCPQSYAEKVRTAMFKAGAGFIGKYDNCSFNSTGEGSFRALEGTDPFVGEKGKLHFENEIRIETVVPAQRINHVIRSMIAEHPYEEVAYDVYSLQNLNYTVGAGMTGILPDEVPIREFLQHIKKILGAQVLRHNQLLEKPVKKIAVCGGSGAFLAPAAKQWGADVFVTADLKYHNFIDFSGEMTLVDAGHFETEQFTKELLYSIIKKNFPTFALQISNLDSNPVFYF